MSSEQITILTGYRCPQTMTAAEAATQLYKGWVPLLDKLFKQLFAAGWNGRVLQMKEKFGSLRFYIEPSEDTFKFYDIIGLAEEESSCICIECGEPGKPRSHHGWIRVVCDKHNTSTEE